ncbi:hypothetical protein Mal4_56260 [Maioricimonas rarisocia]|uniref:DUF3592 domain-containing protein n=1 Tax=Maioricimonas rarisocia TaxID=2528026 RepID=A0A517ZFL8_9PLAN|nr:hypothetical protein [Maioricimonas rarisocia]QDU41261.1 hypothetical protein Mal4_56260 [Maioricimonas rarisocia]
MSAKSVIPPAVAAASALAAAIAALAYPSPRVATGVVNGILLAILCAGCLAVATRQPVRSFWLGFAIVCSGYLTLDVLRDRGILPSNVATRKLTETVEDALPPIVQKGPPGTTVYFRDNGRFPVYYYRFGDDGSRVAHGQMTLKDAQLEGAIGDGLPLSRLPHIDNRPTEYERSLMLPFVLAFVLGLAAGLLSYLIRLRSRDS